MSKSKRLTHDDLEAMGLEETSPGVYGPKKKGRLGNFKWEGDNKEKVVFEDSPDGMFNVVTPEAFDGIECDRIELDDQPKQNWMTEELNIVEKKHEEAFIRSVFSEKKIDLNPIGWLTPMEIPNSIHLCVYGDPTPQQRHRHHQVKGSDFVTTYDPSSKAKKEFLKQCLPYKPDKPYEQPLRVDMVFYFSRPKSHYRTGKYAHLLKDSAPEYHITRPDSDNLAKLVKDALNKVFWKDDSLVCDLNIKKRYDNANPRTEITITPL